MPLQPNCVWTLLGATFTVVALSTSERDRCVDVIETTTKPGVVALPRQASIEPTSDGKVPLITSAQGARNPSGHEVVIGGTHQHQMAPIVPINGAIVNVTPICVTPICEVVESGAPGPLPTAHHRLGDDDETTS